ncbi:hypothetical protein PsYK624_015870 [Phanerochaete sordida]|uniref:Uncharacterized protein n=1 Tax=Phanerochaete sordida TaxID=48140 RepID=A0A9P3FZL1_9APHY|nr:hypothetical protein PsYK624_015870 [Phanerochaete sordida]
MQLHIVSAQRSRRILLCIGEPSRTRGLAAAWPVDFSTLRHSRRRLDVSTVQKVLHHMVTSGLASRACLGRFLQQRDRDRPLGPGAPQHAVLLLEYSSHYPTHSRPGAAIAACAAGPPLSHAARKAAPRWSHAAGVSTSFALEPSQEDRGRYAGRAPQMASRPARIPTPNSAMNSAMQCNATRVPRHEARATQRATPHPPAQRPRGRPSIEMRANSAANLSAARPPCPARALVRCRSGPAGPAPPHAA